MARQHGFWQPYLLYLQASPHSRLEVEVDAVEGCEPSDANLNKLREFLATYCQKPGGIEIVRSDVISSKDARGVSRKALAYRFLNGPTKRGEAAPAFIYVLFYDGALCAQRGASPASRGASRAASADSERKMIPHVELLPYPAIIFLNTRYASKSFRDETLLHEAGHLLGLARRPTAASDNHCLDTKCLMNHTIRVHISRLLTGRKPVSQQQLCQRCVDELRKNATAPSPANLRFVGPVLVRSEAGYHVLSLPSRVRVVAGDLVEQDCLDFMAEARTETPPAGINEFACDAKVKDEVRDDAAKMRDVLHRAKADPFEPVRTGASKMESELK